MHVAFVVHEGINLPSTAHAELYCMKCLCNGLDGPAGREVTHGLLFTLFWPRCIRKATEHSPAAFSSWLLNPKGTYWCAYRKAIHVVAAVKHPVKIDKIKNMVFLPSVGLKELGASARFRRRYGEDELSSKLSQSVTVYST